MRKYFCVAACNSYWGPCRIKWQWCGVCKTSVLQGVITIWIGGINIQRMKSFTRSSLICANSIVFKTKITRWTTTWSSVNHLAKIWACTPCLTCCYIYSSRFRSISPICTTSINNLVTSNSRWRSKTWGCYINPSSLNFHYHIW